MQHNHGIKPSLPTITLDECKIVIAKKFNSSNYKIVNFKLTGLDERFGFLGEHRRLLITITSDKQVTQDINCFAKFLPDNPAQIDFAVSCGAFKKEVFIYEELIPNIQNTEIDYLNSCVPECFLIKENQILVFEDVTSRGYQQLPKYDYFDYNHVIITLKTIAKLHASSLIFEENLSKQLKKEYRLLDDYSDYFYETFYVDNKNHKGGQGLLSAIKGLITGFQLFPDIIYQIRQEQFDKNVRKTCNDIFELVKPSKRYRNVLCHGDLWATNIMMKYENNLPCDALILDFQTARYCPPGHDFMSFIYLTTTREFRKEHFKNLQQFYYDELQNLVEKHGLVLQNLISFEEFVESCKEQKRFAIVQTVTYVQLTHVKNNMVQEFENDTAKWETALYEDRSIMVVENCKKDPEYCHVFKEALKDLRDICDIESKT